MDETRSPLTFPWRAQALTPEEDSVGDPSDDDEIEDLLPADLWFRALNRGARQRPTPRRAQGMPH